MRETLTCAEFRTIKFQNMKKSTCEVNENNNVLYGMFMCSLIKVNCVKLLIYNNQMLSLSH